jgi:PAS domain S-box-containing protein
MAGRITLWNDGAARLYGVTEAEVKGRTAEEIFPSRELARVRDAREATLEAGEFRKELSVTTRDGRDIVIEVHMSLVRDTSGQPTARLTIATDITEKKRQEEQVLRAQRVEILGMLAAGIAHDFNNVLMPVGMVASLLRRSITNPADVQMLDILENSAKRGAGLVRQILGFARGVGGDVQLTQIEHIIRDVGEIIRASFPKSIVLVLEAGSDLRPIQADPTQIQQILLNLAVNARDAMLPLGGLLTIGAENRVLDASAAGALEGSRPKEYLVLEVADTGSGVTPDVLARMWEPFFTTKDEGKGTGLGLSTVRGIAAAHGGFVTVDTRVGLGTTFRVFLPAAIGSGLPGRPIGDES